MPNLPSSLVAVEIPTPEISPDLLPELVDLSPDQRYKLRQAAALTFPSVWPQHEDG